MAKNKAARITSKGNYLYKNSMIGVLPDIAIKNVDMDNYIYIPNINNLKSLTDQMTPYYNSNNELLYYYKQYNDSEDIKIDFGDNDITLFYFESEVDGKKVGSKEVPEDNMVTPFGNENSYYGKPINQDMYGLAYPGISHLNKSGNRRVEFTYYDNTNPIFGSRDDLAIHKVYELPDFVKIHFNMDKIHSIPIHYSPENDAVAVPINFPTFTGQYGTNEMPGTNSSFPVGVNIYNNDVGFISGTNVYYMANELYKTQYQAGVATINDYGYNYYQNSYNPNCVLCIGNSDIVYAISVDKGLSYRNGVAGYETMLYGFMTDDNDNKYLFVYVNYINTAVPTETSDYINQFFIYPVSKLKGFECEYRSGSLNNTEQQYIAVLSPNSSPLELQTRFDIVSMVNGLLGNLIDSDKVPKPPNFDDGGPGISGGGDPYGDYDNVDGVVGGDSDTTKDLNSVDSTPNTSFDQFMQNTGYFGSYVLDYDDLKRYTKTLGELYAHSNSILLGEACQLKADRITSSVTGLHILPIDIPLTDYANATFSMGNTGIMGDGTWNQYINGNNWANANYLKRLTRQFIVELGEIRHNYDNFLDFAPYSTASLFIPYVGKVEIPINLIQSTDTDHRPLKLDFRVDYTTGDFIVILFANINGVDVNISHWNGNCAKPIKVAVNDDSEAIRAGANRIISMISMSASGGTSRIASQSASQSMSHTNPINDMDYADNSRSAHESGGTTRSASSSAGMTFRQPSMPTSVTSNQHMIGNGSSVGDLGYLGVQKIVLVVERPVWWKPYEYGKFMGYPTKKIAKLSTLSGFAKVTDIHVRSFATSAEKEELTTILSEGVVF